MRVCQKKVRMKKSICLYRDCSLSKNCDNFSSITLTGFTFTLFPPTSRNPQPNCPSPLPPPQSHSQCYLSSSIKAGYLCLCFADTASTASPGHRLADGKLQREHFFFSKLVFHFLTKMNQINSNISF